MYPARWPAAGRGGRLVRPRLFIDAQHGLANRLRAIASAASIAQRAGYDLFVIWRRDHHCDCLMSDLFEYPGPVIEDGIADLCRAHAVVVFNYMEVEEGARYEAPIIIPPGDEAHGDVYIRSAYTLRSPWRDHEDEQAFLHALVPSAPVLKLVETVQYPSDVSAHVRMATGSGFDHLAPEAPGNWPARRHQEIVAWRAKSQADRFVARIDTLIAKGRAKTIFLAADLPETYALFAKRYGDRLRTLPRSLYDRSEAQLQYALADMILLSATDRFLASTWSSFSDITARLLRPERPYEKSGIDF